MLFIKWQSGTGVFINSEGIVYDDLDAKQLATVADSKPHRNVDLVVQQADIDGMLLRLK